MLFVVFFIEQQIVVIFFHNFYNLIRPFFFVCQIFLVHSLKKFKLSKYEKKNQQIDKKCEKKIQILHARH
jgi:hypothetical protein